MTVKDVLNMVDELDAVSAELRRMLKSPSPAYRLMPPEFIDKTSVQYARRAGRIANALIDLAERGKAA